jgi:ABC-type multidrug transport system ATPase subunit
VIALALAADTGLLLLDEPTGSLDPESRERFVSLFDARAAHATVVLCSHRLEEILQLVDHVIELRDGHLLHEGPSADFLAAAGRSVVELRVSGDAAARWLREHGFQRGRAGWWSRGVARAGKVALTTEATRALGASLEDLAVRDLGLRDAPARAPDAGDEGGR